MAEYQRTTSSINIMKVLGTRNVKDGAGGAADLRGSIRKGLPFSAFEAVQREIGLPKSRLAGILGIPVRTTARRKNDQHLTAVESDRLYRVARVLAHAESVLGNMDKVRTWLKQPNRGLGAEAPLNLLDTDIGTRQVEDVLIRIEYGIHG